MLVECTKKEQAAPSRARRRHRRPLLCSRFFPFPASPHTRAPQAPLASLIVVCRIHGAQKESGREQEVKMDCFFLAAVFFLFRIKNVERPRRVRRALVLFFFSLSFFPFLSNLFSLSLFFSSLNQTKNVYMQSSSPSGQPATTSTPSATSSTPEPPSPAAT